MRELYFFRLGTYFFYYLDLLARNLFIFLFSAGMHFIGFIVRGSFYFLHLKIPHIIILSDKNETPIKVRKFEHFQLKQARSGLVGYIFIKKKKILQNFYT